MHQESRCSLAGCLWFSVSHKAPKKVLAEAAFISRLKLGRIYFQAHSYDCWQPSDSCPSSVTWLWVDLRSSLASAWRYQFLTCRLVHRAPHNMKACFPQGKSLERERERGKAPRWKPQSLLPTLRSVIPSPLLHSFL